MEERIQKIMAAAGIASRRAAEEIILEGRVRVNGAVVTELGAKADPDKDHIKVDGKLINPKQPKTYLMLNKPAGCVTTMFDPEGRPTVTSLLKGVKTRVYPVGRLDYDTEGLLLLTNDGDFAFRVTHPSHELPKTYQVKIKGVLEDRQIENLEQGVFLKDGKTAPAKVKKLRKEETNSWVEITIHEGRKRQVRRMIDHTGHSVIKLKRVRVGNLGLGDLPLGSFRHLTPDEVKALQDMAQGGDVARAGDETKASRRPAAVGHVPEFIEGPKAGVRPRKKIASSRSGESSYHAASPAAGRQSRSPEGRERTFPTAGRAIRPAEKRFDRPSGAQDRPARSRRPPSEEGSRPRTGQGRTFRDGTAPRERTDRRPESRERTFENKTWRSGQQGERQERTGAGQGERRFVKPSLTGGEPPFRGRGMRTTGPGSRFGQGRSSGDQPAPRERSDRRREGAGTRREGQRFDKPSYGGKPRSFQDRGPRTDERSRPRAGQDHPFGDRLAPRDRADRRPAGDRPWKARSEGRPAFVTSGSRPRQGTARPESRGPRPERRTGWQRDTGSRSASGEGGSRPPMRRSASGPQGRPQGFRRAGPRPAGGSGRPKGPGSRRS
jgi:23S rRNA pseudouridine2605 synthase